MIIPELIHRIDDGPEILVRRACTADAFRIQELYFKVYRGKYPLTIVTDLEELQQTLESPGFLWMILLEGHLVIGSVIYEIDHRHKLGKSFGAVILDAYRGHNLTFLVMKHVQEAILGKDKACHVIYTSTRTESAAPQKLTERLGYRKLGIFPNVRRVADWETHCLAAIYDQEAFERRKKPPVILPELKDLYEISRCECALGSANYQDFIECPEEKVKLIEFEAVTAPNFVLEKFLRGVTSKTVSMYFYPFHTPNLLLISKKLNVGIFLYHCREDNYSCIIGGHFEEHSYQTILESVAAAAKALGIRYLEILVGAYKPKTLREVLNARFLPSAYFPALKLVGEDEANPFFKKGERLDYFVFSRSFEMLDFRNIKLEGVYKKYLKFYFQMWRKLYIEGIFEE